MTLSEVISNPTIKNGEMWFRRKFLVGSRVAYRIVQPTREKWIQSEAPAGTIIMANTAPRVIHWQITIDDILANDYEIVSPEFVNNERTDYK